MNINNNNTIQFPEVYSTETKRVVIEMTNEDGSVTESVFANPKGTLTVSDIHFGDKSEIASLVAGVENKVLEQIRIKIKEGAVTVSES
jgi:hypothetical protein